MWASDFGVRHAPPPPTHPLARAQLLSQGTWDDAGRLCWLLLDRGGCCSTLGWVQEGGGSSCGRQTWGSAVPPPPHKPPLALTPAPHPGRVGRCWAALLAPLGPGRALQDVLGLVEGACSCGRQGKGGVCEKSATQVSLSRTLENFSWPKFLL